MKKAATVTTVEEFRALADYTPVMDMSKDVCMWVVDSDGERRLSSSFVGIMTPEETPEMVIDFPATVLYPYPTPTSDVLAEVLHITGPSETGDLAPMLCGITKVVETPRSPEQPVCQACAAIQTSERNDLDQRAKAQADVLAEVRAWCDAENKGKNPTERRVIDDCADDIIAILDSHGAKS